MEEGSYIKMIDMASGNGGQIQVTSVPLVLFKYVAPIYLVFVALIMFQYVYLCLTHIPEPNIVTIFFCAFHSCAH